VEEKGDGEGGGGEGTGWENGRWEGKRSSVQNCLKTNFYMSFFLSL
jgi:hypothetical protein